MKLKMKIPQKMEMEKSYIRIRERDLRLLKILGLGSPSKGITAIIDSVYSDLIREMKDAFPKEMKTNFCKIPPLSVFGYGKHLHRNRTCLNH